MLRRLPARRSGLGEEEIAAAIEERAAARAAKDYEASDAVGGGIARTACCHVPGLL